MRKHWRKLLTASLIVGNLFLMPIVDAEVKLYTATSEDYASEIESQEVAKLRARDKAIRNATEQAGVYLKTYSRTVNFELTDDEITAIASNSYELVGEPTYTREVKQLTAETSVIIWRATVNVNVDDAEIKNWLKRDDSDRSKFISQTRESQEIADENDRKVEDLRKRAETASDAERAKLKSEFDAADNEFLSNQKLQEGDRAAYKGKYAAAEKLYTEAIELNPANPLTYISRGGIYAANLISFKYNLKDIRLTSHGNSAATYYKLALADYDKALELNPSDANIYAWRGFAHYYFDKYQQALNDWDRALQVDSACLQAYLWRSMYYRFVKKDNKAALADLNKAIEFNPDKPGGYSMRSLLYKEENLYDLALDDITKAIELEPNSVHHYSNRADLYKEVKMFNKAIADYTTYIQLQERDDPDNILLPWGYYHRAECYEALGDKIKAQADMNKYRELERKKNS